VLQILLRVYAYKFVTEENREYQQSLTLLRERYREFVKEEELEDKEQLKEYDRCLNRGQKLKLKILFKEVDQLADYYSLEVSLNRSDAKIKPELRSLFRLLHDTLGQQGLAAMLERTKKLREVYLRESDCSSILGFSPIVLHPVRKDQEESKQQIPVQQDSAILPLKVPKARSRRELRYKALLTPDKCKSEPARSVEANSDKIRPAPKTAEPKLQPAPDRKSTIPG
jgi:hypothetical protein